MTDHTSLPPRHKDALPEYCDGIVYHYVDGRPFTPEADDKKRADADPVRAASLMELMWWRLKQHRLAIISMWVLLALYLLVFFAEIFAPYNPNARHTEYIYAPPQSIHLFHEGEFIGPFVYGQSYQLDLKTLKREYSDTPSQVYPLRFLCAGDEYEFWGLFPSSLHLVCPAKEGQAFLLGTDRLGRDMLSRLIYGARISLSVGMVGIAISFIIGVTLGGLAGYMGGWVDAIIQRMIEVFRSLPELPLWMALSAAVPVTWSPLWVYFCITVILGFLDWPGLARAVRSRFLALREEDYVKASEMMGGNKKWIISRHLVPNFASHLIASVTLSIPSMILGETALSFLGLGLRPPAISWGVLLTEAQNMEAVVLYPWIMAPVVPVMICVLAFNFFGDGLRDAADPYRS